MNAEYIEQLLDKYWEAETSTEEEAQLRAYFSQPDIPPSLKEASELFRFFEQQRGVAMPLMQSGRVNKPLEKQKDAKRIQLPRPVSGMLQIAASIAVFVALVAIFRMQLPANEPNNTPKQVTAMQDTYTDPKEAFEQTKKALMMISVGMNDGTKQVVKLKKFNDAQEIIMNN